MFQAITVVLKCHKVVFSISVKVTVYFLILYFAFVLIGLWLGSPLLH